MVSQNNSRTKPGVTDLQLKNISKSFDSLSVLEDLSLDIYKGELCCLLGPSGCGKTTLLKIINGLLDADSGTVVLGEQDITGLPPQKRNLGMVFQNYALFPHLNVHGNVAYGLHRRHISADEIKNKVNKALDMVRLPGYDNRRIYKLSGGQQQRVALARAIVIEPRVLLLDEPLSNLDARLRAEMRDEIRRIQTQLATTTVYVTHDQEEAMSIADRIVVMNKGVIEQVGTPFDIYENPSSPFVAGFIGNINFIPGEIVRDQLVIFGKTYQVPGETVINSGKVTCAIRPERIILDSNTFSDIRGEIILVTYYGSTIRYNVRIDYQETSQVITVQSPVSATLFSQGDPVTVTMTPDSIHLFPAQ
ncbi:MAG: ABC transporter ATP-binding protein [Dehalococcoidales bacterium]|nr:ABC transporter ATP-binding protein [Dehalococcoidales bacterium]